jgi:hypothetical protein
LQIVPSREPDSGGTNYKRPNCATWTQLQDEQSPLD